MYDEIEEEDGPVEEALEAEPEVTAPVTGMSAADDEGGIVSAMPDEGGGSGAGGGMGGAQPPQPSTYDQAVKYATDGWNYVRKQFGLLTDAMGANTQGGGGVTNVFNMGNNARRAPPPRRYNNGGYVDEYDMLRGQAATEGDLPSMPDEEIGTEAAPVGGGDLSTVEPEGPPQGLAGDLPGGALVEGAGRVADAAGRFLREDRAKNEYVPGTAAGHVGEYLGNTVGGQNIKQFMNYLRGGMASPAPVVQRFEQQADPSGSLPPGLRNLAAINIAQQEGGTAAVAGLVDAYRKRSEGHRIYALAALDGGKPSSPMDAAREATQAYQNLPNGIDVAFQPTAGGFQVSVNDPKKGRSSYVISQDAFRQWLTEDSQWDQQMSRAKSPTPQAMTVDTVQSAVTAGQPHPASLERDQRPTMATTPTPQVGGGSQAQPALPPPNAQQQQGRTEDDIYASPRLEGGRLRYSPELEQMARERYGGWVTEVKGGVRQPNLHHEFMDKAVSDYRRGKDERGNKLAVAEATAGGKVAAARETAQGKMGAATIYSQARERIAQGRIDADAHQLLQKLAAQSHNLVAKNAAMMYNQVKKSAAYGVEEPAEAIKWAQMALQAMDMPVGTQQAPQGQPQQQAPAPQKGAAQQKGAAEDKAPPMESRVVGKTTWRGHIWSGPDAKGNYGWKKQ